jgi:hypothetical protein
MDRITPNLTISDRRDAKNKETGEYSCIITACQDGIDEYIDTESTDYHHEKLADGDFDSQSRGGECTFELFETLADALVDALEKNQNTLIHCHAGVSRSVSIAAAALSTQQNQPIEESIKQIQEARPRANPLGLLENYAKCYAYTHTDCQSLHGVPQDHRPPEYVDVDTIAEFGSDD